MFLSVENYVKASLLEFLHADAVGALSEDLDLVDAFSLLLGFLVNPLAFADLGSGDEAEDL